MKKMFISLFIALLMFSVVSAINLDIEKKSQNEVMILDLNKPAVFDIEIKNIGHSDNFIFYTFFSESMFPKGTVSIATGETKEVSLEIYPPEKIRIGYYNFEYYIKGQDGSEIPNQLTVNVINLENAFEVGSGEVDVESKTINIYIHNKVNFNFENLDAEFSSPFFEFTENFPLGPNQKKEFSIELNKDDFRKLMAGYYTMNTKVNAGDITANIEGTIKFREKNLLVTEKKNYGFIINTQIITKKNEGNLVEPSETVIKKNAFSRLFTTFSPEPNYVEREGLKYYYTWSGEINPGEEIEIIVKTNWIFPFILILLIIAVAVITKQYSKTNLVLRKKVSFVRAKGGEFALKVSVFVHARKYVEKINIMDRLPPLVKLHERFGAEKPTRINEKLKKIEWNFDSLQPGETRVLNYIIYSKIGILGKFALPRTIAVYEKEGKVEEVSSNKTFFITEQMKNIEE